MTQRYTSPPEQGFTPEPGVYTFGFDEDKRRALNFAPGLMSYSKLNRFSDPDKKISKFVAGVGSYVGDVLLFGPDAVMGKYAFAPEDWRKNTKPGKAAFLAFEAENKGMAVLRPKELAEANRLIEIALANPEFKRMLNAPGYCEAGLVSDHDGVRFRSWIDKLTERAIVDVKTSRAANESEFLSTVLKYQYDVQGALYMDQAEALGLGQLPYFWAVISKTTNRAFLLEMPAWAYHSGRRWRTSTVRAYHRETMLKEQLAEALAPQGRVPLPAQGD
jgi:hypothetical protein